MKRRVILKSIGSATLWSTPVITSVVVPSHAQTSDSLVAPTFTLLVKEPFQAAQPNIVVRLTDNRPNITWTLEQDKLIGTSPQDPESYIPNYQFISSNNTGAESSIEIEFFGASQFYNYVKLVATDVDGNSTIFEDQYYVF